MTMRVALCKLAPLLLKMKSWMNQQTWTKDLRWQLQEEKGEGVLYFNNNTLTLNYSKKNRLLHRVAAAKASQTLEMIPKPKGSIRMAGFNLIAEMMLDKYNPKDKVLYNDILVCRRASLNKGCSL